MSPRFLCPVCRQVLQPQPKTWRCLQNHCFDVAREGYVNLLPVQHKSSTEPGDSAESLRARRDFLCAGHYRPLRDAVLQMLAPLQAQRLLDIGCGEGWYTSAFIDVAAEVIGLDIAKPAIQLAAKRYPGITWLVGSGALLPVPDGSLDLVTNLFTQLHIAEMVRVLRPGGQVLVVTPAPDHLWSLRDGLFETVLAHEPDKFHVGFEAQFEHVDQQEVRVPLQLTQQSLRQLLLMTPYAWKSKPERRAALEAREGFSTQAAFTLMRFRRRPLNV